VGEKEKADAASLTGRSETRVQKSFPNRLTPGEIKKNPDSLIESGFLSKVVAYFEQNKWRPWRDSAPPSRTMLLLAGLRSASRSSMVAICHRQMAFIFWARRSLRISHHVSMNKSRP